MAKYALSIQISGSEEIHPEHHKIIIGHWFHLFMHKRILVYEMFALANA